MSHGMRWMVGCVLAAGCLLASTTRVMNAATDHASRDASRAPGASTTDFDIDNDMYEGEVDNARQAQQRGAADARLQFAALGRRLFAASPGARARAGVTHASLEIAPGARVDRPIACTSRITSSDDSLWDYTFTATLYDPGNTAIGFRTRWVHQKATFGAGVGATLTEPIVPGTYRCTIQWSADNPGISIPLPTNNITLVMNP